MSDPAGVAPRLGPAFDVAWVYASILHRTQTRGGDTAVPFVSHLLGVASLVIEEGGTETQAIAALLHDAVEDQGGRPRLEEIRERFGDDVAAIVSACTDSDEDPKPPWRLRKEAYIARLPFEPKEALLVCLADKLYNTRSILMDLREHGSRSLDAYAGGRDGTLWYYRTLVSTYRSIGFDSRLVDELDRTVTQIEALAGT